MAISSALSKKSDPAALRAAAAAKSVAGLKTARDVMRAVSEGRSDFVRISPYSIVVEPGFNCRNFETPEAQEDLRALAEDIAKNGVLKPGHVWVDLNDGNKIKLIDGERRLRATLIAIEEFGADILYPAVVGQSGQSQADRVAEQARHNMGVPFTILEKGALVRKLLNFGWDSTKIADRTGYNAGQQARALKLAEETPEEIKDLVTEGRVSATDALKVVADAPTMKDAVRVIEERVAVADAKGSKRVTAKHSAEKALPVGKALTAAIRKVEAEGHVEFVGNHVSIPRALWDELRALGKLD